MTLDFTLSNARRFYSLVGNPLDMEGLNNHDNDRNKTRSHKLAYLILKNSFARFARAFLFLYISKPFSCSPGRKINCFTAARTT